MNKIAPIPTGSVAHNSLTKEISENTKICGLVELARPRCLRSPQFTRQGGRAVVKGLRSPRRHFLHSAAQAVSPRISLRALHFYQRAVCRGAGDRTDVVWGGQEIKQRDQGLQFEFDLCDTL